MMFVVRLVPAAGMVGMIDASAIQGRWTECNAPCASPTAPDWGSGPIAPVPVEWGGPPPQRPATRTGLGPRYAKPIRVDLHRAMPVIMQVVRRHGGGLSARR